MPSLLGFSRQNADHISQVTINVETHEMVDVGPLPKHDPEWPDMVSSHSSASKRSVSGDPKAYGV